MIAGRSQRGLALVSVLWGVTILAVIAAALATMAITSARIDRNTWSTARADALAEAAINRAILSLLDDRLNRQPRIDGVPTQMTFGAQSARVAIQDEAGRININFADKDVLKSLFVSAGLEAGAASDLAEVILTRRNAAAPHVVFQEIGDLARFPGVSDAIFSRIASATTVYSGSAAVDHSVAPRDVLRVLPDLDNGDIAGVLNEHATAYALKRGADDSQTGSPAGTGNHSFTITAEVSVGTARIRRTAVVQFTGDEAHPYLVLAWN